MLCFKLLCANVQNKKKTPYHRCETSTIEKSYYSMIPQYQIRVLKIQLPNPLHPTQYLWGFCRGDIEI